MATADAPAVPRALPWLLLLAAALVSAGFLWSRRGYVPIFDGRIYADCVARVASDLGYFAQYRCAGHIAESYVAILALAARLVPHTFAALLVANVLLFLLGAAALWRIVLRAFPAEEHSVGRALVVGAYLVHPIVLAAVVQPGLDLGLLVFSLCALAAAVVGRRWTLVLFGMLLIFSKEPGILIYGAIAAVWLWRRCSGMLSTDDASRLGIAALFLLGILSLLERETPSALFLLAAAAIVARRRRTPPSAPRKGIVRALLAEWPLALPVLLLAAYVVYYKMRASAAASGQPVVWGGDGAMGLILTLLRGGVLDPSTRSSLLLMFVVGFLWVPSLWMLADLVIGAVRHARNAPPRPLPGVDRSALGFVLVVLLAEVWLLSRYVTYSNARYYLPVFPLALVAAYAALVRLRVPLVGRGVLLASVTGLLAISTVRTLDPVSRAIWGTFDVGERSLLSITSLRKECCGHGRDQLAYNLEFTELAALQDSLYQHLRPTETSVLVLPYMANWFTVEWIDTVTHQRTLRTERSVRPFIIEADSVLIRRLAVPTAWYVELPYASDAFFRDQLAKVYEFGEPCEVTRDGYALSARPMRLRATTVASPSIAVGTGSGLARASACAPSSSALSAH